MFCDSVQPDIEKNNHLICETLESDVKIKRFGGSKMIANICLRSIHVSENFGGVNCPVAPLRPRA